MKALRTAGMVVAAVALVATTAGLAAPAVAATATTAATAGGIAGVSAATLGAIGAYGGLAAGVLSAVTAVAAPGISNQGSATSFQTNPQSGLPYAMGRTRMSGLRIYANTNTRPGYTKFNDLLWFGALLSIGGQIDSIEKFTADNEVVTFDATGNANGTYRDYQGQKIHLGGSPMASALALSLGGGTAPGWTSQHKLSGITHAMWCLRYNKQGEMYGAGAPEPAWIGKWVKVYDPRLDSTYPGGSGACRALQESTYVWSDNPGLHALTWALGRWQNGKRTCGIGAPVANIRVAEFVECANVCDANAWKVGGVEWTTDSKWDTLKRILQAGGAVPTQTAAMIGCLVSMPRTAIATIESRHLHDNLSIAATKSRRDRFNTVIPRYVDEDSDWSVISGTAVSVADYVTADKGQRTKEIDFPLVQVFSGAEAKQPGQLAAYEIVNSREAGPWALTVGPEFIGLQTGDVVNLNVPEEGLDNQPVLIKQRGINPATGKVTFTVETETFAKHAFALGETTTPPAPWSPTAPDLKPPAPVQTEWTVSGTTSGEGFPALLVAGDSEMPSADAIVIDYRLLTAGETPDAGWTNSAILSAVDTVRHVIAPLESQTAYDVRISYRVGTIDGDTTIFEQVITGVGKITTIENQLQDQDEALAQLDEDIEQAEANISAAQAAAAAAQVDADAAKTSVEAAQQEIINQGSLISQAQSDIVANATSIETVANTVSSQGASITTLQQTATSQSGSIATLQQQVVAGTPNMLRNPGFTEGTSFWSYNGKITPSSTMAVATDAVYGTYISIQGLGGGASGYGFVDSDPVAAYGGVAYVCACNAQVTGNPAARFHIEILYIGSNGVEISRTYGPQVTTPIFSNSQSDRLAIAARGTSPAGTAQIIVRLVFDGNGGNLNFAGISQVKLEAAPNPSQFSDEISVRTQYQAISANGTSIASLTQTVSTQGGQISNNATAITTLQGTVTSLSTTVSTHGASITSLQTASTNQAGQIATLQTRVVAGSPNLLANGGFENGPTGWSSTSTLSVVKSYWAGTHLRIQSSAAGFYINGPLVPADPNVVYTASADTNFQASTGVMGTRLIFLNASGNEISRVVSPNRGLHNFDTTENGRAANAATGVSPAGTASLLFQVEWGGVSGLSYAGIRLVKVESGSTWSPYSSEASIVQSYTALSTTNTQLASLQTTVSTQGASITSNATAISTLQTQTATLTQQVSSGNPNLLSNAGFENGLNEWAADNSNWGTSNGGGWGNYAYTNTNPANGAYINLNHTRVSVDQFATYTLTGDALLFISGGSGGYYFQINWSDASDRFLSAAGGPTRPNDVNFDSSGTNRQFSKLTATAPAGAAYARIYISCVKNSGTLTSFGVRQVKFERGNVATPYSNEASVNTVFSAISTANSQLASLQTTVSTQGVTITSQQTAITTINNNVTTLFGRAAVTVDVNGRITGWETNNNGTVGDFTIRSDRFRVIPPGGAGSDGFYIDIDSSSRTTQYILSGGIRVVESGWLN